MIIIITIIILTWFDISSDPFKHPQSGLWTKRSLFARFSRNIGKSMDLVSVSNDTVFLSPIVL